MATSAPASTLPRVYVTACAGAVEGALNVVRALGERQVPVTVIGDYNDPPAARSRYCSEFVHLPGFTRNPAATLRQLLELAAREIEKPMLFPTADPDLLLAATRRSELAERFHLCIPSFSLIENLTDKQRFSKLARSTGLPFPRTYAPAGSADVAALAGRLAYPMVLKPSNTAAWSRPPLRELLDGQKAIIVSSPEELLTTYSSIATYDAHVLLQEYIPGDDPEHFVVQAYMNGRFEPVGCFVGQKLRTFPPYTGSGCYVRSVPVEAVAAIGINVLRALRYSGLADIDFKRDPRSGEFKLIEINPRVGSWNILATRAGVNLPYIAYADTVGIPYQRPPGQKQDVYYLHMKNDFKAFLQYRRDGRLSWPRYLLSLFRGRKVFQFYAIRDLCPFLADIHSLLHSALRRVAGATLRLVRSG